MSVSGARRLILGLGGSCALLRRGWRGCSGWRPRIKGRAALLQKAELRSVCVISAIHWADGTASAQSAGTCLGLCFCNTLGLAESLNSPAAWGGLRGLRVLCSRPAPRSGGRGTPPLTPQGRSELCGPHGPGVCRGRPWCFWPQLGPQGKGWPLPLRWGRLHSSLGGCGGRAWDRGHLVSASRSFSWWARLQA